MKSPYYPRNLIICQTFILNYISSQKFTKPGVVSKPFFLMKKTWSFTTMVLKVSKQSFLCTYPHTSLRSKSRKYSLIEWLKSLLKWLKRVYLSNKYYDNIDLCSSPKALKKVSCWGRLLIHLATYHPCSCSFVHLPPYMVCEFQFSLWDSIISIFVQIQILTTLLPMPWF